MLLLLFLASWLLGRFIGLVYTLRFSLLGDMNPLYLDP